MRVVRDIILGLVIGIAGITPGLSGGALAAAMGIYEPIIRALSSLARNFRQSALFLLPLACGGLVGVLAFSRVMEWLMLVAPSQVKLLFLGLVAGSLPALLREANSTGFRLRYLLASLLALVIMYQGAELLAWPRALNGNFTFLHYAYFGFIYAIGSIIPGISSSFVLIHIGAYDDLLRAIATAYAPVLIPAALGFGLGALLLVRVVEKFFSRYHGLAYYSIVGFLLGSALLIWPDFSLGWMLVLDAAVFAGGILLSVLLLKFCARFNA
ncbi:MAG: hypothetical protein DDT39_00246 [Firmicutes bacterium]|nr:hypothetical protein [candidate division NPL-UPA2 bacterium]MBT9153589.1 hypothetical protein [candidate division NPL-UPA2 bacterium]